MISIIKSWSASRHQVHTMQASFLHTGLFRQIHSASTAAAAAPEFLFLLYCNSQQLLCISVSAEMQYNCMPFSSLSLMFLSPSASSEAVPVACRACAAGLWLSYIELLGRVWMPTRRCWRPTPCMPTSWSEPWPRWFCNMSPRWRSSARYFTLPERKGKFTFFSNIMGQVLPGTSPG